MHQLENRLNGAEFKLEKMKEETSTNKPVVDDSFAARTVTTGDSGSPSGIAEFEGSGRWNLSSDGDKGSKES